MNNQLWQGVNSVKEFVQPDGTIKKLGNVGWFTNLPVKRPTDRVILWNHFSSEEFPTYDNYAAFECSKLAHLPIDKEIDVWINKDRLQDFKHTYQSDLTIKEEKDDQILVHIKRPVFGVPITFLDKYNPSSKLFPQDNLAVQFKILGEATGNSYHNMPELLAKLSFHPEMKYGGGLGSALINGKAKYARILIRARSLN